MPHSSEQIGVPAKESHLSEERRDEIRQEREYEEHRQREAEEQRRDPHSRLVIELTNGLAELGLDAEQEAELINRIFKRMKPWVKLVYKMEFHNDNAKRP